MDDTNVERGLDRAAALIGCADALLVCAGAGIGVDSGLPDFRGEQGFWRAYPALGAARIAFHDIACPTAFQTDARLAWGFYGHRLNLYRRTVPHAGFALLRRWAATLPEGGRVFTSNVDGQFQRAGFDCVAECHGSIHHLQCIEPCCLSIWDARGFAPEVDGTSCRLLSDLPLCPHCGALARPNVLMFGDGSWCGERTERQLAGLERWLTGVSRPLLIEIGAGSAIPSVRRFGARVLRERGGNLVRINPREAMVDRPEDVSLPLGALQALTFIDERLNGGGRGR